MTSTATRDSADTNPNLAAVMITEYLIALLGVPLLLTVIALVWWLLSPPEPKE